jgi:hypothetical protein
VHGVDRRLDLVRAGLVAPQAGADEIVPLSDQLAGRGRDPVARLRQAGLGALGAAVLDDGAPDRDDFGEPAGAPEILESDIVNGPVQDFYTDESLTWDDLPDEWYFFCRVHANMNAVGTVAAE